MRPLTFVTVLMLTFKVGNISNSLTCTAGCGRPVHYPWIHIRAYTDWTRPLCGYAAAAVYLSTGLYCMSYFQGGTSIGRLTFGTSRGVSENTYMYEHSESIHGFQVLLLFHISYVLLHVCFINVQVVCTWVPITECIREFW